MSGCDTKSASKNDYYTILGLTLPHRFDEAPLSNDKLKIAYHRTLLKHHPDKVSSRKSAGLNHGPVVTASTFTVDQIIEAYETLSDPILRLSYHKGIESSRKQDQLFGNGREETGDSGSGLETYDLEDLNYKEESHVWFRKCRCGGVYEISELQLEGASADGEVILDCHGCSLRIKVTYQMLDGD